MNRQAAVIQDLIERSGAAAVAVAYRAIVSGDQLLIRPDEPFSTPPARSSCAC